MSQELGSMAKHAKPLRDTITNDPERHISLGWAQSMKIIVSVMARDREKE